MIEDVLMALLPLFGAIVGASLQHFFVRSADASRHKRSLRVEAYSDYLRSVGEVESDPTDAAAKGRAIAAKARVCVHGSANAVEALAMFEADSSPGVTAEKRAALRRFLETVRSDMGAEGNLSEGVIERILFAP